MPAPPISLNSLASRARCELIVIVCCHSCGSRGCHATGCDRPGHLPTVGEATIWARRLVQPSYQPSFRRALHAFVRRIGGQAVQMATVEDGERSLAVVLAAEESAQRNMPVDLP